MAMMCTVTMHLLQPIEVSKGKKSTVLKWTGDKYFIKEGILVVEKRTYNDEQELLKVNSVGMAMLMIERYEAVYENVVEDTKLATDTKVVSSTKKRVRQDDNEESEDE